jgi:hypothetical protein
VIDTDGDGIPNLLDNDSDNDGIPDRLRPKEITLNNTQVSIPIKTVDNVLNQAY